MPERYIIIPEHAVVGVDGAFEDAYSAAVQASRRVEKDRVPRVVVQVIAHVRESRVPKVDIVEIAQIARIAGVHDG